MATSQIEHNIEEWANEFITAYYSSVIYSKNDVSKFYDPDNAIIYRENFKENSGKKISEASDILIPYIGEGDKLMITQFHSIPIQKGFDLSVFGKIIVNEKTNLFSQFFTIKFFDNRAAIISDSLMNINFADEIPCELIQIPRPSYAKQNAFRHQPSIKNEIQQQHQADINNVNNDNVNNKIDDNVINNNADNNTANINSINDKDNPKNNNNQSPSQQKANASKHPKANKKAKNSKFRFTPE